MKAFQPFISQFDDNDHGKSHLLRKRIIPLATALNKGPKRKGILNFISIQLIWSIFLDFFQNKIIDDKSKNGSLWSILCSILLYILRIKKKTMKDIELINQFFLKLIKIFLKTFILSHDACTELLSIFIFLT